MCRSCCRTPARDSAVLDTHRFRLKIRSLSRFWFPIHRHLPRCLAQMSSATPAIIARPPKIGQNWRVMAKPIASPLAKLDGECLARFRENRVAPLEVNATRELSVPGVFVGTTQQFWPLFHMDASSGKRQAMWQRKEPGGAQRQGSATLALNDTHPPRWRCVHRLGLSCRMQRFGRDGPKEVFAPLPAPAH